MWYLLMTTAVLCHALGLAFTHNMKSDDSHNGVSLTGLAFVLLAPFLFYAAGAMGVHQ